MPWKMTEDGQNIAVKEGKPIWVYGDGKEAEFDADHTLGTIKRLNDENKTRREEKEAIEGKFKLFEGIEDPDAARQALERVKSLSAGELKTAEQVEEIRKEAQKSAEEQVRAAQEAGSRKQQELAKERDKLTAALHGERIGGAFSRSKFVTDKVAVPQDMLQSMFSGRFKTEDDGKIVGHDAAGNKIYSRTKHGEIADFDEALETIIDGYSNRDMILKGTGSSGSGAQPNRGGGGGATVKRSEWEKMTPTAKQDIIKTHTLVDG